jgi:hypothetical protein
LKQDIELCPFCFTQQLYTLLDRKKQTVFVSSWDFTLIIALFCSDTQNISSLSISHTYVEGKGHSITFQRQHTEGQKYSFTDM